MSAPVPVASLAEWTSTASARNGERIRIRPLRPDDREREIGFINSLSEQSRYFRLFTPLKFLSQHLLDQLMDVDYDRRMALVATVERDGAEQFVGIARYGEADRPDTAELGITVTDAWQHCGIAKVLMIELMRFAHWRGFRRMVGAVLPQNHRMISLARSLGFTITYDPIEHLTRIARDLDGR